MYTPNRDTQKHTRRDEPIMNETKLNLFGSPAPPPRRLLFPVHSPTKRTNMGTQKTKTKRRNGQMKQAEERNRVAFILNASAHAKEENRKNGKKWINSAG